MRAFTPEQWGNGLKRLSRKEKNFCEICIAKWVSYSVNFNYGLIRPQLLISEQSIRDRQISQFLMVFCVLIKSFSSAKSRETNTYWNWDLGCRLIAPFLRELETRPVNYRKLIFKDFLDSRLQLSYRFWSPNGSSCSQIKIKVSRLDASRCQQRNGKLTSRASIKIV